MGRAKKCMKHRKNCRAGTLLGSETDLQSLWKILLSIVFPLPFAMLLKPRNFSSHLKLHKERGVRRCFRFFGEGCRLYKDPMHNALTDMYIRTAMRY